jgi:hypothetical protein
LIAITVSLISGAAGGITIYTRLKKKKPDIRLECTASNWRHRREDHPYSDIYATLLLQNKGETATTINRVEMTIYHNGNEYSTTPADPTLNIKLEPGDSTPKQFKFVIARATVELSGPIERATITANTLHGKSKSIEIKDIQPQ